MPTDPATVPTLTQKEIAEAYTVALTDTRWTDGTPWVDIAPVWRNQEVAFAHRIAALAAARVDHELKDKRDKVMHMHDLYDALGVEWGRDPFSAIAALKAARVDTAEVERRAKYEALTKLADEWNNAAFGVSGPHLTLNATLHASARMVLEFRDRECPAPAPRECVLSVYGSYSVIYTGAMPCPYRIQRGGVEVFACALASQASAWIGKQDDGFHLDDAQMGKLLAFAAEVGQ